MKKLLIVLSAMILLGSCNEITHVQYPLVVVEVTNDYAPCIDISPSKYRIQVETKHGDKAYIFTTKLFNVGDTIK